MKAANHAKKTIIADAIKITTVLNKHLRENCAHCHEFLEAIFTDEIKNVPFSSPSDISDDSDSVL